MTAPNHIIGGYAFTGLFGSFIGVNILSDWKYLIVILLGTLLPDVDHTRSIIGRLMKPISIPISRHYGHRTITHSILFLISSSLVVKGIQVLFFPSVPLFALFFLSMSSHLIFDMMTIQGVPLFYPFKKNPCVIPANPAYRLKTNNLSQEAMVFTFFMISCIFLAPLMKKWILDNL